MTFRIGVLGASGIAPKALIRPVLRRQARLGDQAGVVLTAVAARKAARAAEYAAEWGFPRSYGSYSELLADNGIDLVYNALPPSEHARWSIAALEAGKHVLCEKPFTLNAREAEAVAQTAARTGYRVIEAFHDSYHPFASAIREAAEPLGLLTRVEVGFSADIPFSATSIRHVPSLGGGALMDLGCYCVHELRHFLRSEPRVLSATAECGSLGADNTIDATLAFPGGSGSTVPATLHASMAPGPRVSVLRVWGEHGTLEATNLVFPHEGNSIRRVVDGLEGWVTVGGRESYDHQLDAVCAGLDSGQQLPTEGADSVANMTVIDAIYAAAGVERH